MGKIGQERAAMGQEPGAVTITEVAYRPALSAPIGMDVVDFAELRARGRRRGIDLSAPQRPAFHHLIHVRPGSAPLEHTVDFTRHVVPPGGWLWVRPGQVHQYAAGPEGPWEVADGVIVIWRPGFVPDDPPEVTVPVRPAGPRARLVDLAREHLVAEYADMGAMPLEAHNKALRALLSVLLLRLAHAAPGSAAAAPGRDGPFERFRAAVERDFTRTHRVADYAAGLGYSTRTLTRATLAATGTTAKAYLDARIVLEAKRLLVHTDLGAADVARHLGFTDPADFGAFFRRHDGRTPLRFRAAARGTAP
ncbi:transcriptional regulator [Streptomyces daghestanicus]|uniref:Transcriptional regulator n=3 Tax=Streptomyces TaxID=1883 RepID=A0A918GVK1_STRGD|nr:transcriptional regulator [Streptomyces niveoruber]GGT15363.1 transcriptional regulator [Streptomyces griseoviridis]GGU57203.1 transcriptional regulator [Streptomyces daghestanicus]GHI35502.1 transcriptional regulator [Streptomyces daghestanicus]